MAVLLTVNTNPTLCVLIIDHYHDWLASKVWGFIIGSAHCSHAIYSAKFYRKCDKCTHRKVLSKGQVDGTVYVAEGGTRRLKDSSLFLGVLN